MINLLYNCSNTIANGSLYSELKELTIPSIEFRQSGEISIL